MGVIVETSLGQTLDSLHDAEFMGYKLPKAQQQAAAAWIGARQGLPGAYGGMFAPTAQDFEDGARVYTGERIKSRAGVAHVLGEEASRVLHGLGGGGARSKAALERARAGMLERLREGRNLSLGRYCCGTCTCAVWRNMLAGGLDHREQFFAAGLVTLHEQRDPRGRWRFYPFYYTLLCLVEMQYPGAVQEMKYAAPVLERALKRSGDDKYALRRAELARRVLARC